LSFEKGPEDFPSSVPLLILCLVLFALSTAGQTLFTENLHNAMGAAAVATGILIIFIPVVLGMAGLGRRIIQTMTAFAIAGTAVNLFYIVSLTALTFAPVPMLDMGITSPFKVPLTIYGVLLYYGILRRALMQGAVLVSVLAILYVLLTFLFTSPFISGPKQQLQRTQPEKLMQSE
jgi:hypothetical protein